MAKTTPLQISFAAGEITPRIASRTDARGYREGCSKLRNFMPLSQGPAKRRPGTFVRQSYTGFTNVRLVPFPVAPDEYYILAFYGDKLSIFNEVGEPVRPNLILNPRFQQAGTSWTAVATGGATVTFSIGSVILNPSNTAEAAIRQNVTGLTIGKTYKLAFYGTATNFRVRAGTAAGGAQFGEAFSGSSNLANVNFTASATNVWIECAALAGATVPNSIIVSSALTSSQDAALVFTTPYTQDNLQFIQHEMAPAGRVMYFAHPLVPQYKLTLSSAGAWDYVAVTFIAPPADWTTNNYPSALTFFQGRLWFGGTPAQPSKFWASKSGDYENFTAGTLADDSLVYTIAKRGTIRWMTGLKNLLIGTDNSEFVVSSEAGVITPTDIVIEPQSSYGSAVQQPIQLGNQVLYVSPDERKLRAMGYRFEEQGWVTQDLSFASEHITVGKILELSYAQNPESIVWMVTRNGGLLGCTYERGNNIIGWHRHDTPEILWVACCTARFLGTDALWLAGKVELESGPEVVVAVNLSPNDPRPYMDLARTVSSPTPTTVFGGFNYLEGKTVSVRADGGQHPDVVVTGGNVVVNSPASEIVAGLPYKSELIPMPIEIGQHPKGSEPVMKRLNRLFLRLLDSQPPIINGVRPPVRFPVYPMDEPPPIRSNDVFVTNLGWSRLTTITVVEDQPVPCQVLGIFGEMDVEMPE